MKSSDKTNNNNITKAHLEHMFSYMTDAANGTIQQTSDSTYLFVPSENEGTLEHIKNNKHISNYGS